MRVLVIGRSLPDSKSSFGLFEFEQAKALAEEGFEVIYGFSDNRSIKVNRSIRTIQKINDGIPVVGAILPVGGLPKSMITQAKSHGMNKVLNIVEKTYGAPDIVYAHFPLLTLTSDYLERLQRESIPLICLEHWTKVLKKDIGNRYIQLLKQVVTQSDKFCCVSDDLKRSVIALVGEEFGEEKYEVIPNIVDENIFYPDINYTVHVGSKSFITACRLVENKRIDFLLEAFAMAHLPNTQLIIAGDGEQRSKLEKLTRSLDIDESVKFLGWLSSEELAARIRSADCYISASNVETFNLPIAEAWMCGIPCIAENATPLRNYFSEENGLLFKSESVEELAICMKTEVEKASCYDARSISSWAKGIFSKDAVIGKLSKLISESAAINSNKETIA